MSPPMKTSGLRFNRPSLSTEPDYLNNGGEPFSDRQEAMRRYLEYSNEAPTYTMWRILEPQIEGVRKRLAAAFGCHPEEMAITRNASEALEICQLGLRLQAGDEVLTTEQDYPRMLTTWRQRERRDGIVVKRSPYPPVTNELADSSNRRSRRARGCSTFVHDQHDRHFRSESSVRGCQQASKRSLTELTRLLTSARRARLRHAVPACTNGCSARNRFPIRPQQDQRALAVNGRR
jgi:hypothetical protein